jgi:Tetracyclin repressor-like, C-terminal domain
LRLRRWLDTLVESKHSKALTEPELSPPTSSSPPVHETSSSAHVETLVAQLARIITDGVAAGAFETGDARAAARAVFDATARFHNPVHAAEWSDPGIDAAYKGVRSLVLDGLAPTQSDDSG